MKNKIKVISVIMLMLVSMAMFAGCSNSKTIHTVKGMTLEKKETTGNNFFTREYFLHFEKDTSKVVFKVQEGVYKAYEEGGIFDITYDSDLSYVDGPKLLSIELAEKTK